MAESGTFPIHIIRYEDLVSRKEEVLTNLFEFALEHNLDGTYLQERIRQVTKDEQSG